MAGKKLTKFDFVIGNPPYQSDGKNLQQIYPQFYLKAQEISNCVDMIFPQSWQEPKNGSGLSKINKKEYKEDKQIVKIDNYTDVFKNVNGAKYTNIVIWKRDYDNGLNGSQLIYNEGKNPEIKKLLCNQADIKKPDEIELLAKIVTESSNFVGLDTITSVLKPYGLRTDVIENYQKYHLPEIYAEMQQTDDLVLYHRDRGDISKHFLSKDYPFPKKNINISKYKVLIGKTWGNMSGEYLGGSYSDIIIAGKNEVCTEKFLESGTFDTFEEAQKHAKFLMSKFCRALLFKNKSIQDNSKDKWIYVPKQTYKEDWWNESIEKIDEHLFDKYKIPENIREFVRKNIQPKTEENIINYKTTQGEDNE